MPVAYAPLTMATASVELLAVPSSSTLTKHDSSSSPSTPNPPTPGTARSFASFRSTTTAGDNGKKRRTYKPDQDLDADIDECRYVLQLFLESRMLESEMLLKDGDPKFERLYIATGYGLIQSVKAFMSYEDKDLGAALEMMRTGSNIASKHRKPVSLASRVTGLVMGSNPVPFYKSLTPVQRHAELVYAECLAQKAILGIVYSGDWLAFIKEAINMRSCIGMYKGMLQYLEAIDAEAVEQGKGPIDTSVDAHFRSGVYLGMGVVHLILSLLPGRIIPILELFGYKGDRKTALDLLARVGGWKKGQAEPEVSREQEGLRRSLCDIVLLIYHLVFSGITYNGIDIDMAQQILEWNAKRYPSGVFFLFAQGRLALFRANPTLAIQHYTAGMEVVQEQFKSLQGISLWELAFAHLAMWDVPQGVEYWRRLKAEAGWSKAIYTYGLAVSLYESGEAEKKEEATRLMDEVPGLLQKIAGKSIPLEKFVSRKARKYKSQQNRLLLPALELAYVLFALARSPRSVLTSKMLPLVNNAIGVLRLHESSPETYGLVEGSEKSGVGKDDDAKSRISVNDKQKEASVAAVVAKNGFWDDYCLAHFLRGVCLRFIEYPDPYATTTEENTVPNAPELAKESFEFVLEHGPKIVYDHHLVYWSHYELGRLEARNGHKEEARRHLELVLSGKVLEVNWSGRSGKYSLENALHVRTNAALEGLENDRLL